MTSASFLARWRHWRARRWLARAPEVSAVQRCCALCKVATAVLLRTAGAMRALPLTENWRLRCRCQTRSGAPNLLLPSATPGCSAFCGWVGGAGGSAGGAAGHLPRWRPLRYVWSCVWSCVLWCMHLAPRPFTSCLGCHTWPPDELTDSPLALRYRPPAAPPSIFRAAFAQQMAKLYNNLGLKMMERRKHEEALGLVRSLYCDVALLAGILCLRTC